MGHQRIPVGRHSADIISVRIDCNYYRGVLCRIIYLRVHLSHPLPPPFENFNCPSARKLGAFPRVESTCPFSRSICFKLVAVILLFYCFEIYLRVLCVNLEIKIDEYLRPIREIRRRKIGRRTFGEIVALRISVPFFFVNEYLVGHCEKRNITGSVEIYVQFEKARKIRALFFLSLLSLFRR